MAFSTYVTQLWEMVDEGVDSVEWFCSVLDSVQFGKTDYEVEYYWL